MRQTKSARSVDLFNLTGKGLSRSSVSQSPLIVSFTVHAMLGKLLTLKVLGVN